LSAAVFGWDRRWHGEERPSGRRDHRYRCRAGAIVADRRVGKKWGTPGSKR